jgi:hypothetical protein
MIFWLKLLSVPLLAGLVSLAGRKWGPLVSGWLVGLPLTSGPVVFFLALEQGTPFAAQSAKGTMFGLVSVCVFSLTYSRLANHFRWPICVAFSCVGFFLSTFLLQRFHLSLLLSFFIVLLSLGITLLLLQRRKIEAKAGGRAGWEIVLRMVAATSLVLSITELAHILGPYLAGLLTPFPIFTSVFAIFTHRSSGASAATGLLRGVIAGLFTFAVFFFMISSLITKFGIVSAFLAASSTAIFLHACSLWFLHRKKAELPA